LYHEKSGNPVLHYNPLLFFLAVMRCIEWKEAKKIVSMQRCRRPGLPDFSWSNTPKHVKIYQINTR
jgi:hypothetical protein